jgi:hypothetical protein
MSASTKFVNSPHFPQFVPTHFRTPSLKAGSDDSCGFIGQSPSLLKRRFTSLKWKSGKQRDASSSFLKCFATSRCHSGGSFSLNLLRSHRLRVGIPDLSGNTNMTTSRISGIMIIPVGSSAGEAM